MKRGIADAAGGIVDHALESLLVVEIAQQAEVGEDVFDFLALIERKTTVDAVGEVALAEHVLEGATLGVGAIEDGDLVEAHAFRAVQPRDDAHHLGRLFLVSGGGHDTDFVAFFVFAEHHLFYLPLVVGDDTVGSTDDVLGGAIVLLELDGDGFWILAMEVEDVVNLRSAERVDALGIVAHYADVGVVAGEEGDNGVLRVVGVLVFVDKEILETLPIAPAYLFVVGKEEVGVEQEVVEIESPCRAATPKVFGVDVMGFTDAFALIVGLNLGIGCIILRQDEIVFGRRDASLNARGGVGFVVQSTLLDDTLDEGARVGGVIDGEIGLHAHGFAFGSKDARKTTVERAAPQPA